MAKKKVVTVGPNDAALVAEGERRKKLIESPELVVVERVVAQLPPTDEQVGAEVLELFRLRDLTERSEAGLGKRSVLLATAVALDSNLSHDDIYMRWPESRDMLTSNAACREAAQKAQAWRKDGGEAPSVGYARLIE